MRTVVVFRLYIPVIDDTSENTERQTKKNTCTIYSSKNNTMPFYQEGNDPK